MKYILKNEGKNMPTGSVKPIYFGFYPSKTNTLPIYQSSSYMTSVDINTSTYMYMF